MTYSKSTLSKYWRHLLYNGSTINWRTNDKDYIDLPVPYECYKRLHQIGKGTYGAVDLAKAPSKKYVALKRLLLENERGGVGFPITALREIKILSSINHPNIVQLLDVVSSSNKDNTNKEVFLVFEYLDHDLAGLINNPDITFKEENIKYYMLNLFEALYYLHEKCNVLHRDIKGSNLLINNNGDVKLGDFGLSRIYHKSDKLRYTTRVVTLWYRAPELLFGDVNYTPAIDVWSAACLMCELYLKRPLFPGKIEAEQIDRICSVVGSPSQNNYPKALKFNITTKKNYNRDFSRLRFIKNESHLAYDLICKILLLDPEKRLTAGQVLDHDYFHSNPKPKPAHLGELLPSHDFESLQRLKKRKRKRY